MANYVVLPEGEEEYRCGECGEHLDSAEAAANCCTSPYEGYKCTSCGATFNEDERSEAANCCPNIKDVWICNDCNSSYEDEDEAQRCCAPDPEDIVGGRYKCVVDGYVWPTPEQAAECCRNQDSPSVAVEDITMHASDCRCYHCKVKASETPEARMAAALSAPEPPKNDDWTKALRG